MPGLRILTAAALLGLLLAACSGSAGGPTPRAETSLPTPGIPQTAQETGGGTNPTPFQPGATGAVPTAEPTAAPSTASTEAPVPTQLSTLADAKALPDPNGFGWKQVAGGLDSPIGLATARDGSGRLFVLEKPGRIRIIQGGQLLPDPFLDNTDRVGSGGSEQGLLGLAFDPQYTHNGYFYVNYTDQNGDTSISRFQVTGDPNRADPGSEKVLLRQAQPFPNHNGGEVTFGPDGMLYLGLGDGGSAGDPHGNGQNTNTWLGKILRIDVSKGDPYAIPPGNPFVSGGGKAEVWAYGLRNPWRFSFDRKTGDLYIADVGQDLWEEVDFLPAGSGAGTNFGWAFREGKHRFKGAPPASANLVDPVAEYSHADGGCSVTGGFVYRGAALPEWQGVYLYGDYCSGKIWGLLRKGDQWSNQMLYDSDFSITSFGEDEAGEVYLVDYSGGIYRLERN